MARTTTFSALLVAGSLLAGCASTGTDTAGLETPNRSVDSINQPVVQRTDFALDLGSQGDSLGSAEQARLAGWFRSLGIGYGDRIWVEESYPSEARNDIARVAADFGLLLSEGAPVTLGQVQAGSIRVVVSRSTASVPNCPNWSGRTTPTTTSPNYGCATNSNLAAMIADPADLVLGQSDSGSGAGATATKAIKLHREKQPTGAGGLAAESTGGK